MMADERTSSEASCTDSPSKRRQPILLGLAIGLLGVAATIIYWQRDAWVAVVTNPSSFVRAEERSPLGQVRSVSEGFHPITVIPRSFPPITDVPIATAAEVEGDLHGSELVLGIVIGDEARAYPINMLTGPQREIINDTLGDVPIAATW